MESDGTNVVNTKEDATSLEFPSKNGSINSMKRMRSFNTGSISSNASSLRKRFGFPTLNRENSKIESNESKVGSVWRTLSKTARGAVTGGGEGSVTTTDHTNSKISLTRSKSTDIHYRTMLPPQKPGSRDRPTVLGAFKPTLEESPSRPQGSSHRIDFGETVETSSIRTPVEAIPRRKRRSSLSDLKSLQESPGIVPSFSPLPRRIPDDIGMQNFTISSTPRTPSPVKIATGNQLQRSIRRKENNNTNSPFMSTTGGGRGTLMERATNIQSEEAPSNVKKTTSNQQYHRSPSGIPVLKGSTASTSPSFQRSGSKLGIGAATTGSPTKKATTSPQKLRIPSPQKVSMKPQFPLSPQH